jgi:hypothetical protein
VEAKAPAPTEAVDSDPCQKRGHPQDYIILHNQPDQIACSAQKWDQRQRRPRRHRGRGRGCLPRRLRGSLVSLYIIRRKFFNPATSSSFNLYSTLLFGASSTALTPCSLRTPRSAYSLRQSSFDSPHPRVEHALRRLAFPTPSSCT